MKKKYLRRLINFYNKIKKSNEYSNKLFKNCL